MKKVIVFILALCIALVEIGYCQDTLPGSSTIRRGQGRRLIKRYQRTEHRSNYSSFLIKAFAPSSQAMMGLGDYICQSALDPLSHDILPNPPNRYLHIYIASNANTKEQFLVIAPTILKENGTLEHDNTVNGFWKTTKAQPCCVENDRLDGSYSDENTSENCNIELCTFGFVPNNMPPSTPPDMTHPVMWNSLYQNIQYYQSINDGGHNTQINPPVYLNVTESFLVSAYEIRSYLLSIRENVLTNPLPADWYKGVEQNVKFIQFYYGNKRDSNSYAPRNIHINDSLTIVSIGVGKDQQSQIGTHIFSKSENLISFNHYVFDEGLPCPTCYVDFDNRLDFHRQYTGPIYTGITPQGIRTEKHTDKVKQK